MPALTEADREPVGAEPGQYAPGIRAWKAANAHCKACTHFRPSRPDVPDGMGRCQLSLDIYERQYGANKKGKPARLPRIFDGSIAYGCIRWEAVQGVDREIRRRLAGKGNTDDGEAVTTGDRRLGL
jgi:hypothetical protein